MSEAQAIAQIEAEVEEARAAITKAATGKLEASTVTSVSFYHSSRTRHTAAIFKLQNGATVFKGLPDDEATAMRALTTAQEVVVWYDENKLVQQYFITHRY